MTTPDEDERGFPAASVLIVDEVPANLVALGRALEPLGHELMMAHSGGEALRLCQERDFALMIVDALIQDGMETVERLQAVEGGRRTPVVFLSAEQPTGEELTRAYTLGAIDYLTKPVAPDILKAKVAALVSLYRRGRELERRARIIATKERETAEAEAARSRAEQAVRLKDRYIGILGHDLRSPLSVVSIIAQQLVRHRALPEALRERAQKQFLATERMQQMISDLIDFTRGQLGGGIPVIPERADFGELCRTIIDELRSADESREITLETHGELTGEWDGPRVQQALANLISNALVHGRGQVHVKATADERAVTAVVHNRGSAIPPEELPAIFEPFKKSRSKGLGLGLYIVREIVRAHGGTIEAQSGPTEGTTFTSRWPRDQSAARVHPR